MTKDIKELFDFPMGFPVLITQAGFDVILYDCGYFTDEKWWPTIEQMKPSGWQIADYARMLAEHGMTGHLPSIWNCCDGIGYDPERTGLVHFTDMRTQPWKPYPEHFDYPPHPRPDMVALWEEYYEGGLKAFGLQ